MATPEDLIGDAQGCWQEHHNGRGAHDRQIIGIYIPSHLIGIETKNSFNGTWGTDATWHKIFYKDIKAHEMFTGTFEAEKTIKFHENPVPEKINIPCEGIDC